MNKFIMTMLCAFGLCTVVYGANTNATDQSNAAPTIQYMVSDPGGL